MNKILLMIMLVLPVSLQAQDENAVKTVSNRNILAEVKTVKSPDNRVAMLELYTSEGCSSCPPADRFLSDLKSRGVSDKQVIAMAFHVTYWDYIGWKDRFANEQFDERQRTLANKNKQTTVYTPQFVFSGEDYRRYSRFSDDVKELVAQKSTVDLELTAHVLSDKQHHDGVQVSLKSDISRNKDNEVGLYIVVLESNLFSNVSDGENDGKELHHDYVVRKLYGPYFHETADMKMETERTITLLPEWKQEDLSIVAFAENPDSGEILQVVRMKY